MRVTLTLSVLLLTACNTAPEALLVSITPESPYTGDDLVAEISGELVDPDGDEVSYSFTWYQDEEARPGLTELTVPASETAKGETWKLFVQPTDGTLEGPPSEAEVLIVNTPPSVEVSLSPEAPLASDDIVATASATDVDGDDVSLSYAWSVDGEPTDYDDATLPDSATLRGEIWTLEVIPNDGEEPGEPTLASVSIQNTAPLMHSVSLSPAEPREGDTIAASVIAEDEDGDTLTISYTWTVDGVPIEDNDQATLSGEHFDKHQQVQVSVTPNDGFIDGESMESEPVGVVNTAPSITGVSLDPTEIYEASEISCVAEGWSDDDGDAEGYTWLWEVNGLEVGTGATLSGEHFDKGDNVACTATPDDGEDSGEALDSDASTVLNTPPAISAATLSTTSPVAGDTITVSVEASDDDGDAITLSYAWYVDSLPISTNESLDPSHFDKHQAIHLELTPNDGGEDGATFTTATATAVNTPPEITSLSLSPSELYTDDTLAASVTTTDTDGDTVNLSYAWTVDGSAIAESGSSLDGATWFDKHQTVALVVTPNDGEDDGDTAADSVDVLNSPPGAPIIAIEPEEPEAGLDDLVCTILTDGVDADEDSLDYSFLWEVDGAAFTATSTSTWPGDTVTAANTSHMEEWTCVVTSNDGDDDGDSATATTIPTAFTIIIDEDWESGTIGSNWTIWGSPEPFISTTSHGGTYAVDNAGDSSCDSGLVSAGSFYLTTGTLGTAWIYSDYRSSALYQMFGIGALEPNTTGCPDYAHVATIQINPYYSNEELRAVTLCPSGSHEVYSEPFSDWSTWFQVAVAVNVDGTVTYSFDGSEFHTSSCAPDSSEEVRVMLGGRSSSGNALADDIYVIQ